jgi:hypothetical protein
MARSFDWERSNREQKAGPKRPRRRGGPTPDSAPLSTTNFPPTEKQRQTIRAIAARYKLEATAPELIRTRREASAEIRRLLWWGEKQYDRPHSYVKLRAVSKQQSPQ